MALPLIFVFKKRTSNIEHRTSNVELWYAFGVSILLKKWAKRYPHSMFTRLRRRQRRPGFIFFMQNKSPLGIAKAWSF